MKKQVFIICILLSFTLLSIRSLFSRGFFPMHDDTQVARVYTMTNALKNGQFPVRIVSDLGYGYGYPIFNFYAPLPYYIGAIASFMGFNALDATKIMIGIGMLIGSFAMYMVGSWLYGPFAGVCASFLFTYYPYRAVQLYVRGAVSELWAVSFMPFVLLGVLKILRRKGGWKNVCFTSISLTSIILSHTVFGYISAAFVLCISLVLVIHDYIKTKKVSSAFIQLCISLILSLGLSAFFFLPAYEEMKYTNLEKVIGASANYHDHFVCIQQLWDSQWGYGGSSKGCIDGMSFKLGKVHIIAACIGIGVWLFLKKKEKKWLNAVMIALVGLISLLIFMMLDASQFIWSIFPLSAYIQYPWRFLGPLGICISLVSSYFLYKGKPLWNIFFIGFVAIGIYTTSIKLFVPQYLNVNTSEMYTSRDDIRFRASKASDEYLPKDIYVPKDSSNVVKSRVEGNDGVSVLIGKETEVYGDYRLTVKYPTSLRLNMAYFPGWHFYLDGKEIKPNIVAGQPNVILSSHSTNLTVKFLDTPIRKAGNIVSFFSLIVLGIIYIYGQKTIRHNRHSGI